MATRALDVTTILHALMVLSRELKTANWKANNGQQEKVFAWLEKYKDEIAKITGLDALASNFWEKLNEFLVARGFDPMVSYFDPSMGIGVVSVLDKLVQWLNGPGEIVEIATADGMKPGFELPPSDVNIYEVDGYADSYLLELLTKSNDTLWLFVHGDTSLDGLEMVELSMDVMNRRHTTPMRNSTMHSGQYPAFARVQVPMVDFNVKPDISWLTGADMTTEDGASFFIDQVAQQFMMRMDETGARVKVATVIVVMRAMIEEPQTFIVNKPFYCWWTQDGVTMPMAVAFVDFDSMRKPAGSLKDM